MNHRENILAAMRREKPDRVPFQLSLCPSLIKELKRRYGTDDVVTAFDMPVRYIDFPLSENKIDYSEYHKDVNDISYIDEWGVGHKYGSVGHFTRMLHPMKDFTEPEQVWNFPTPNVLEDERWAKVEKMVEETHAEGRAAAFMAVQVFEPAWYLRGLDNLLADMLVDEDMAAACLEKMTQLQCSIAEKAAQAGVDIIIFGDDVGTQKSLMMSIELWRKWIKPTTAAVIKAAKRARKDVLALYHSDGVINDIIPELIEIGVDILNPVQPECVDPILIKKIYGDKLSFWGTIGTQTTMPFGSPEDVKRTVREMIETVGNNAGLVLAPTHVLEPEIPWENIEAFLAAVKEYGQYCRKENVL